MADNMDHIFEGISPFEQLLYRLSYASLHHTFSHFAPDIVFTLACTSHTVLYIVTEYSKKAWDVNALFKRWFQDPVQFREVMNSTRAIVGGMVALQFFDRGKRDVTVFDIFVRFDGLLGMGRYLISEGYKFQGGRHDDKEWDTVAYTLSGKLRFDVHRRDPNNPFSCGLIRSFRFIRVCRHRHGGPFVQTIRLVLLRLDPIKWILSAQSSE